MPFSTIHYHVYSVTGIHDYLWLRVVHFDWEHILTTNLYLISSAVKLALLVPTLFIKNNLWQTIIITVVVLIKSTILTSKWHNFDPEFKQRKIPFEIRDALQERYSTFTILGKAVATIVEHIKGKNYLKLISFRGFHITFLPPLSLEIFLSVNLFRLIAYI